MKIFLLLPLLLVACSTNRELSSIPPPPVINTTMKKRIALFFDGTSNVPKDKTNVFRLYEKVSSAKTGNDGLPQVAIYMQGVGTRPSDFFTGAAFGRGVSRDVRDSYATLRKYYREGDEIFLFGFSRGAFTARSLAGFIAQYGIVPEDSTITLGQLYGDYRKIEQSRPIYRLKELPAEELSSFENDLIKESTVARVRFTGVWDTVSSVGMPWGDSPWSRNKNKYFETDPRLIYDECYQALAIDERRPDFRPILWKSFLPGEQPVDNPTWKAPTKFEQRWFVGVHSNVGGGYKNPSGLYKVPLHWMEGKAAAAGLAIPNRQKLEGDEHLGSINTSFEDFTAYKIFRWVKPQLRPLLRKPEKKVSKQGSVGWVYTRNEIIDETAHDRAKKGGSDGTPYSIQDIEDYTQVPR